MPWLRKWKKNVVRVFAEAAKMLLLLVCVLCVLSLLGCMRVCMKMGLVDHGVHAWQHVQVGRLPR